MIAVTGATGHLGNLVVKELLARGAKPSEVVAVVRDESKAKDLKAKGVQIRIADYADQEALAKAFAGVDRVLLVSANEVGKRTPQHKNVVDAAKKAGVKFLAYTSIPFADTTKMLLAKEHLETEKYITASGIPHSFLRDGWYIENYGGQIPSYIQHGGIAGSAKDGKVSAAPRADYAAAAAVILLNKGNVKPVYELGGSKSFTLPQLAQVVSKLTGKSIGYHDVPVAELKQMMLGGGRPEPLAEVLSDSDLGISRGELFVESHDLENLLGRPPGDLEATLRDSLK